MRFIAGRPQTVLDIVREALLDSRRASDAESIDSVARRLCERLKLAPELHARGFGKRHDRLAVEADRTTVFIPIGDIRYVEARGHLVSILRSHGFLALIVPIW